VLETEVADLVRDEAEDLLPALLGRRGGSDDPSQRAGRNALRDLPFDDLAGARSDLRPGQRFRHDQLGRLVVVAAQIGIDGCRGDALLRADESVLRGLAPQLGVVRDPAGRLEHRIPRVLDVELLDRAEGLRQEAARAGQRPCVGAEGLAEDEDGGRIARQAWQRHDHLANVREDARLHVRADLDAVRVDRDSRAVGSEHVGALDHGILVGWHDPELQVAALVGAGVAQEAPHLRDGLLQDPVCAHAQLDADQQVRVSGMGSPQLLLARARERQGVERRRVLAQLEAQPVRLLDPSGGGHAGPERRQQAECGSYAMRHRGT
jgi:hypothetical protein